MRREQLVIEYVDDLTGETLSEDDVRTIRFGWRGAWFEIDLSSGSAEKFELLMSPYVKAARVEKHEEPHPRRSPQATDRTGWRAEQEHNQAIRAWGRREGMHVPDRGRIPREVRQAFEREFPTEEQQADAVRRWKEF